MPKFLINTIKKVFQIVANKLIEIIVLAVLTPLGIYLFSQKQVFLKTIKSPMPIWAAYILVLICVVYIYVKIRKIQKTSNPPNSQNQPQDSQYNITKEIIYLNELPEGWKVKHRADKILEIYDAPYCKLHKQIFVYDSFVGGYICPRRSECKSKLIETRSLSTKKEYALSYIESHLFEKYGTSKLTL
jgi:hypothetical protein